VKVIAFNTWTVLHTFNMEAPAMCLAVYSNYLLVGTDNDGVVALTLPTTQIMALQVSEHQAGVCVLAHRDTIRSIIVI
jgi:hypothetical protein